MIWFVFKHSGFSMGDYMLERAERRIDQLERELRQIKLEADRMQWDIRRVESAQSRTTESKSDVFFWVFPAVAWLFLLVVIIATKAKTG